MRKFLALLIALTFVIGMGVSFADVQIDAGQQKDSAPIKFLVVRNGSHQILSKDRVVIWDSTSKDGITVKLTTTSADKLVAGIMMDTVIANSSDNTVAEDLSRPVWGRMQTWGLHDNARCAAGSTFSAGDIVITSMFSGDLADATNASNTGQKFSADGVKAGIALEACSSAAAGGGTFDLMVKTD